MRSRRLPVAPGEQPGHEVDGRGRAGHQLERQRPELEPVGDGVAGGQQLVRLQRLQQLRPRGQDPAVRTEELVRRAGQEVGAEGGLVHGGVGHEVHPVDEEQRATVVHEAGDRGQVRSGADQVRRAGDGDEAGPRGQLRLHVLGAQLTGLAVEPDPADGRPDRLGRLHPRADVGVVVQPGDDDLVTGRPRLRQRPGQVVGQGGHAPPEDHPAGVGAHEVGHGRPGIEHDAVGAAGGGADVAAVGDVGQQGGGDRLTDHRRHLRATRAVEVGGACLQCRELRPDGLDVKAHGGPLLGTAAVCGLWCAVCGPWSARWMARGLPGDHAPRDYEHRGRGGPSPLPGPRPQGHRGGMTAAEHDTAPPPTVPARR